LRHGIGSRKRLYDPWEQKGCDKWLPVLYAIDGLEWVCLEVDFIDNDDYFNPDWQGIDLYSPGQNQFSEDVWDGFWR
jgi:hypothetical protein